MRLTLRRLLLGVALVGVVLGIGAGPASAETKIKKENRECIEKLETGKDVEDCHKAPSPILPASNEIVWGSISFVVLLLLLWKLALPAVKKGMDDRTERIRNSLDEAETVRSEAERILADYQAQLADARAESGRIIEEARQQADQVRRDLTARAEAEAAELRQRNADQVAGERDRVMAELRGQVATLAIELAEKVVAANLDRDANLRLIEDYINNVGNGAR